MPGSKWMIITLVFLLLTPPVFAAVTEAATDFSGRWQTTFGELTLTQQGDQVSGIYVTDGIPNPVHGTVTEGKLIFRYQESDARGEGWFVLSESGNGIAGQWREEGSSTWGDWSGERVGSTDFSAAGFAGLWSTTYGPVRLRVRENLVDGVYLFSGSEGVLTGTLEGELLNFNWFEKISSGTGSFQLAGDGKSFSGEWTSQGSTEVHPWSGLRHQPVPGRVWLLVLEAAWEESLEENEYSFGGMLKSFFARTPQVQVRHRFFSNRQSFRRWCREIPFLAEPVLLSVASHGESDGLQVAGESIDADWIADSLNGADNISLLHFSSCRIMAGDLPEQIKKRLGIRANFPLSGYSTYVDWGFSAVFEMTYFELMLVHGYSPAEAAKIVMKMMPLAGDLPLDGAPVEPAGFRFSPVKELP